MSFALQSRKSSVAPMPATAATAPASLQIGEPDDVFEREADRVADRVLARAPPAGPQWSLAKGIGAHRLQRACACGASTNSQGECAECKEKETLQRKATGSAARSAPPLVGEVLRAPGAPLHKDARQFFEARFQRDFSSVRIHTDAQAAASAKAVNAAAYTVGNDLVFGSGNYDIHTDRGRRLVAHELAHTIQQTGGGALAATPVLRRATIGWSGAPAGTRNAGESHVGRIRRIAVGGLSQGFQSRAGSPSGRAIVLIPSSAGANPFDPTKPVDVLLHFHGHDTTYGADAADHYKDVDIFQIESQLEASGKTQLVGILPQGDAVSSFGDAAANVSPPACDPKNKKGFDSDAFVREIFAALSANNLWSSAATSSPTAAPGVGNVMISGHSGAGELINENLLGGARGSSLPSQLGQLKEITLFDAINGPCEFLALSDWLQRTLTQEAADLKGKAEPEQLKYLKQSMRFRSYFERSAAIGDYYSKWNIGPLPSDAKSKKLLAGRKPIADFLQQWFKDNSAGLPPSVVNEWVSHYAVVDMGQVAHDNDTVNIMSARTPGGGTPLQESLQVLPKHEEGAAAPATGADELIRRVLRGPVRGLHSKELHWAREHFGRDLSHVRIHTDQRAAESAKAIRARAFTVGPDIVFAPGEYASHTPEGRRLLGHELTHVLQQGAQARHYDNPSLPLSIGSASDTLEAQADYHAVHGGTVRPSGIRGTRRLQRAPAEGSLAKAVCETSGNSSAESPGECNYARPEHCPTYESWISTFTALRSFRARATPQPGTPGKTTPNTFTVLGGEVMDPKTKQHQSDATATRFQDPPARAPVAQDANAPAKPATALKLGETFIDHPTDAWVKACLPDNLRATAYQLPADCADIAIILRHVWLSAHHRTQMLKWGRESWTIGDLQGGAAQRGALKAITDIGSQSVQSLVAPYSDAQGAPLLSFNQLEPLLHAGDILVWEHREHGLDKGRTGGHTLTITAVNRDANGKIKDMSFLQGNEPIFGDSNDPANDDKGKIIKQLGMKDTQAVRDRLGSSPGRRIEAESSKTNGLTFNDVQLPPAKKGAVPASVWGWGADTILLAAGPPRAANRPAAAAPAKGSPAIRRLTDWVKSFAAAPSFADWQAAFESMLLEARAFVEGGIGVSESDARQVGEAAGQKIWRLAKTDSDSLANQGHFARLQSAKATLQSLASTQALTQVIRWIEAAFDLAARGAADISFGSSGAAVVKILLTGFDPFEPSGSLATPSKGTWNPSGAAVLALDNQTIPARSSKGQRATVRLQGVILPVSFEAFQAGGQGLVEKIVTEHASDMDAAITVSMAGMGPFEPVRLERYVVGTHAVPNAAPQTGRSAQPIPAAAGGSLGAEIIESNAPLQQISDAAEITPQNKSVGNFLLRFADAGIAQKAAAALNGKIAEPKKSPRDVSAVFEQIPREVHDSMHWATNGSDVDFSAGGVSFQATVLRAPSGVPKPTLGENLTLEFANAAQAATAARVLRGPRDGNRVEVSDGNVVQQMLTTMVREPNGIGITFSVAGSTFKARVLSGPGGDFLSNEVSYRMLRLLKDKKLAQDPLSFHVHTGAAQVIPDDGGLPGSAQTRALALTAARGMLGRLVAALKRICAATAQVILDRRSGSKP